MKKILTILSAFVLTFNILIIGAYAQETNEPSNETDVKNWQYWNSGYSLVTDNKSGFLARRFAFSADSSAGAEIYAHAMETLQDSWDSLTTEEKEYYDNDFRYYVGYQILGTRKTESVNPTNIDLQPEAEEAYETAINLYIEEHPLSYVACTISSYNFMDASRFPNYQMYVAVKNYMKEHDGYHVIQYIGTYGGSVSECRICTISHDNNLGFIGTVTEGIFNNVRLYKDWVVNYSVTGVLFRSNGTSVEQTGQSINQALHNTNSFDTGNIFTSYGKNELVYVFQTLNAYKNYNAGVPQNYYQGTYPDDNASVSSIENSNNSY